MRVIECDRCHRILEDQHYEVPFHLRSTDIGTNTLCKTCVDNLKRLLVQFWKVRSAETTRERVGHIPPHYTMEKPGPDEPHHHPPPEPRPNILERIYDKIFYKKVYK